MVLRILRRSETDNGCRREDSVRRGSKEGKRKEEDLAKYKMELMREKDPVAR